MKTQTNTGWMLGVAALILSSGCGQQEEAAKGTAAAVEVPAAPVETLVVTPRTAPVEIAFTALVVPEETVKVAPQLPGKIKEIRVNEGDFVKAGQVLMVLDDEELKIKALQAKKAHESALVRLQQLKVASEIEEKSLALGIKQAQETLTQVKAKAKVVESGARPQEKKQVAAAVDMAKVRLESTRRELDRMNTLLQSEVIPQQNFDQFQDGYKLAEAQYRQALEQMHLLNLGARSEDREAMESAVRQTEVAVEMAQNAARRVETTRIEIKALELSIEQAAAAVESVELALSWTEVKAPVDGRIEQRLVEPGSVVGAGVPAFVMLDTSKTEIQVLLREEDRRLVHAKATAMFAADALEGEGPFAATVKRLSETADPASGLFPVFLLPDAAVRPKLKGGMFVRGTLTTGSKPDALVVPTQAIVRSEGKKIVFVAEGGTARKREVTTGQRYATEIEILSGLSAGEHLIVTGQVGLVDGVAVAVTGK